MAQVLLHPIDMVTARLILLGVVVAQLADAATFTIGVSRFGIGVESNAIAAFLYAQAGLGGVLAAKGAVLVLTVGLLVATAESFRRVLVWGGAVATSFGLVGFAVNTASIVLLST